jgi:peptidoglycan/xylan/chitin deacetylase (PgdA/CDA1 family)
MLGKSVNAFCYPYGDYSSEVVDLVQKFGFEMAFTVDRGTVIPGADPFRLRRLTILGEPSRDEFHAYLTGAIMPYWRLRQRLIG